jgi:hypothetical protein
LLTCLLKIEKNKTDDCKIFTLFNVLQVIWEMAAKVLLAT